MQAHRERLIDSLNYLEWLGRISTVVERRLRLDLSLVLRAMAVPLSRLVKIVMVQAATSCHDVPQFEERFAGLVALGLQVDVNSSRWVVVIYESKPGQAGIQP
jgi:hypothetical protein